MKYLTPEQVIFIHSVLISETGGTHGIRDLGLLQAAAARPQATFDGQELYPTVFLKAAALLHSLIKNHPFLDGNKRTGITAAGIFLQMNGWHLRVSNEMLEAFTLRVAEASQPVETIAFWLEANSQPVQP